MKNQFGHNTNENISALEVYYFKVTTKQSLSSCKQNIDSIFVLTLKYIVNFQGRNIFVGIVSKLIFHKDILKLTDL